MKKAEKDDNKKICRWLAEWDSRNLVMKKLGDIEKKVDVIETRLSSIEKEKPRKEYTPEYIGKAVDRIQESIGGIEKRVRVGGHSTLYVFLICIPIWHRFGGGSHGSYVPSRCIG